MIVSPKHQAVLLNLQNPNRVTATIPTAKTIQHGGRPLVVVPHRLDETLVLRNLGFRPPSPIRFHYSWAGSFAPFSAQIQTAEFLTLNKRGFVLSDIGTGKTLATLWAIDYLMTVGAIQKALIVAPLSTLERAWGDEIFRHFTHREFAVLHGSRGRRTKLLDQDVDFYIVNHDGVKVLESELADRPDINHVVLDEISQAARNASTQRWKSFNRVINKQHPRSCWGLTGTPTPNAPTDSWAQVRLLLPDTITPYANRFRDMVMRQVGTFKWVPRNDATETVHRVMQPAIRFRRDECVDLPPCIYSPREAPLTDDQQKAYKAMAAKLKTEHAGGEILAVNEAVKISKLVQIACGVAYDVNGEEVSIPAVPRLEVVREVIEEAGTKVIVFVPFVSSVRMVAEHLRQHGLSVEVIHGQVKKADRDSIFKAFQQSTDPQILVAQPAAMSHGLTLTAASTIIWYAPITSNDVFEQANGRITRPGQKNTQVIVMIEGTPVERRIYSRLRSKQTLQGVLLDLFDSDT